MEVIPHSLKHCAKLAEERGYHEINLNVGCPSDRVQNGMFGACLMAKADLVAECISEMQSVVNIPVTVKTRIGIDDLDSYEFLCNFIKKSPSCRLPRIYCSRTKSLAFRIKPQRESRNSSFGLCSCLSIKKKISRS